MNLPVGITALRIIFVPLFTYLLYLSSSNSQMAFWAGLLFLILSLTDYLDGYLARKWSQVSNLGKFLDPLADKVLILAALIVMVDLKMIAGPWVILVITREMIVMGIRLMGSSQKEVIAASPLAKLKTVLQMFGVGFLIMHWPYGLEIFYASVVAALVSMGEYIYINRHFLKG